MSNTRQGRTSIRLVVLTIITLSVAACDAATTSPLRNVDLNPPTHPPKQLSDTLNCLSGYIIVGGREVCL